MLKHFGRQLRRILRVSSNVRDDESGSVLVEYGLLIALMGVAAIVSVTNASGQVQNAFNYTSCKLQATANAGAIGVPGGTATDKCTWGNGSSPGTV